MGIRDEDLDAGLFEAFHTPHDESALQAIQRLHGAGSTLLLRDAGEDASPILLRRDRDEVQDDPRYQILGEIARGGIGVVYKAHDKDLNRDVAVKVLRPEYAERDDVIQRFVEEAQVGGQLQHPGIVPIYGLGLQPDGRPSFVMKLIKGQTLAELLDDNPRGVDLLAVFEQVAQTVAYAHSRGVIHRDLKPANVMVGAFGEVQVVDWGFAKVLGHDDVEPVKDHTMVTTVRSDGEGSQSMAGSVMGTPAYMPPEQAMGRIAELDERSDVFALGAILCEILTGKPPYTGEQKDQLIAAMQCRLEPAHERLDSAGAASELVQIARACLQPLSGDRPRDAGVVADRLHEHFASVEDRARQAQLDAVASESQAAQERYARRRALVLAAAAMVAILAGGGGYLWWQQDLADREAEAGPRVAAALREATGHEGQGDWTAAVAKAREAFDLAVSAGIDDSGASAMMAGFERQKRTADEAEARLAADTALLAELEQARAMASDHYAAQQIDGAYVAAIRKRWPELEVDTSALRDSQHAQAIAAALDSWAYFRRHARKLPNADWRQIDGWARAIDPEHNDLRDAVATRDYDALQTLAESLDVRELLPDQIDLVGRALGAGKRREVATALLKRAQRAHPSSFWLHYRLGDTARLAEQYELAATHLRAALALRPQSVEVRHSLGMVLVQQEDLGGAIAVWRDAIATSPRAWLHGRMHIAFVLQRQEEFDAARRESRAVIELSGDDGVHAAEAHHRVGVIIMTTRRDWAAAENSFRRAIELDPTRMIYHLDLGYSLRNQGDMRGAAWAFEQATRLAPTNWFPWKDLALARESRGDFEGAFEAWQRTSELRPVFRSRPAAFLCDLLRRYDESIAESQRLLRSGAPLENDGAWVHCYIGVAQRNKREWAAAIESMERAVRLAPDVAQLHYSHGLVLDEAGRFDSALRSYRRTVELSQKAETARLGIERMARFVAWESRLPELVSADGVSLSPSDRAELGYMLLCKRQYVESAKCYQRALTAAPQLAELPAAPFAELLHTHGYRAIRSAANAGKEWRDQALSWMRIALAQQEVRWVDEPRGRMVDLLVMRHDPDLAPIRDVEDLSDEWKQYWADHDALIARIQAEATR